ncbi:DUF4269 domain-containing protein [Tepidibacter aestuarii]|uniref:DUF4269 domain-containing protein n=1 Tax=Tepidibacter aestuarii TaxID=2925782 RepID=UPI0020BF0DBE|nr:DUF4269 domain-containing protein [Tepidibacter aestuarii]CAH2212593.1 conserved protein of unknown function [Tepidibacter aestuarii]
MYNKNWKDISYLKAGNDKQRKSYEILTHIKIFNILSEYNPILVGTIPLGIDIENSDLDIICKVNHFEKFKNILIDNFAIYKDFKITYKEEFVTICNFIVEGIEIEIYGSTYDTEKSNGYRHMIVEDRLLNLYGDNFRKDIIDLKINGLKTEPAFAKVLKLEDNPYKQLLLLETYSDEELYKKY